MRYGVLLVGFEYIKSERWKTLPGIPVDLYQAYRYCKNITKNILVFTDIDKDYRTSVLQRAILDGYVDSGLLSFIEDIKEKKQYTQYNSKIKNGYSSNNFDKTIKRFVGIDRLVIYYTGHGKNGDIILPDNTHVSLEYIRDLVIGGSDGSDGAQIVSILDCCQSNGMGLPYIYQKHIFRLDNTIFRFDNTIFRLDKQKPKHNFISPNIICISSSHIHEDSTATHSGSLFTMRLFGYLNRKEQNIILLSEIYDMMSGCGVLGEGSYDGGEEGYGSFTIYSSYPNNQLLWNWFVKSNHNNIEVLMDNNNSIITVVLHNCQNTIDKSDSMRDYIRYHHNGRYET